MSLSGWMLVVLLYSGESYDIHIERDLTQKNCYLLARTALNTHDELNKSAEMKAKCVEEIWTYD